jgi:hypothetical protein
MNALLKVLLTVTFTPLAKVVAASISPLFSGLTLDKAQIVEIVTKVGSTMEGQTVEFTAMGIYTAAQVQEIAEGVTEIVTALLGHYGITGLDVELGRLLVAVAGRMEATAE